MLFELVEDEDIDKETKGGYLIQALDECFNKKYGKGQFFLCLEQLRNEE